MLVEMSGKDVGTRVASWWAITDTLGDLPSPVPREIRGEVTRTMDACVLYFEKSDRLTRIRRTSLRRYLAQDDPALLRRVQARGAASGQLNSADRERFEACASRVDKETAVIEPDTNVFSTAAFEAEVAAYARQVDGIAAAFLAAASAPASRSATRQSP